jgi:Zn-dependent peptidase ImmA (M78 family)/DNA-binding XRE family transcriptional regulator
MTMDRRVNPEMLVLARESRGLTQTALASAVAVTQATLSKYESGVLAVADEHVLLLAKVLDYPVEFFYQFDQVWWTGSGCMYHRKRQAVSANEYRHLLARVNVLRMNMGRLLRNVAIDADEKFFRMDIAEYGTPVQVATLLRNTWNLPRGPISNITTAIEAAGGIVMKCDFGTPRIDAFSQWPPGMPPMFFVNRAVPPDRYRYTLAHEIGHIVMHLVPTVEMEREADEFAAEFLMPSRDIIGHLGRPFTLAKAAALKAHWRVSMAAIIHRARDLDRISDAYYKKLMAQLSKAGYRKVEPVALEDEEPSVMTDVVNVHMNSHGYSTQQLSRVAMMNEAEFIDRFVPRAATNKPPAPHLRQVK